MYTSLKLAIVDKTSAGSANVLSIFGQAGCTEVNLSMDFSIISQSDFFIFLFFHAIFAGGMEGSPPAEHNSAAGGIPPDTDCVEGGMEQFSSNFSFLPPVIEGKKNCMVCGLPK